MWGGGREREGPGPEREDRGRRFARPCLRSASCDSREADGRVFSALSSPPPRPGQARPGALAKAARLYNRVANRLATERSLRNGRAFHRPRPRK